MQVNYRFEYIEDVLPSPRHRVTRERKVQNELALEIRELTDADAPVVIQSFVEEGYGKERENITVTYRLHDGRLFCDRNVYENHRAWNERDMKPGYNAWNDRLPDVMKRVADFLSSCIVVDGVFYSAETKEPYWRVWWRNDDKNSRRRLAMVDLTVYTYGAESWCSYFPYDQADAAIAYADKMIIRDLFPQSPAPVVHGQVAYDSGLYQPKFDPMEEIGFGQGYWGREWQVVARMGIEGYRAVARDRWIVPFGQMLDADPVDRYAIKAFMEKIPGTFLKYQLEDWINETLDSGFTAIASEEIKLDKEQQQHLRQDLKQIIRRLFGSSLWHALDKYDDSNVGEEGGEE